MAQLSMDCIPCNCSSRRCATAGRTGLVSPPSNLIHPPGTRYISRKRSNSPQYLKEVFQGIFQHFEDCTPEQLRDGDWLKENKPYTGEVLMGHLRYGTHGDNSIETCHPFVRLNNWITRNLVLAGNFNLTNVDELFDELVRLGQYPKERSDTVTVLEKIGHFVDSEVERLFKWYKQDGIDNEVITPADHGQYGRTTHPQELPAANLTADMSWQV